MNASRREFIKKSLKATALTSIAAPFIVSESNAGNRGKAHAFQFSQVKLPYAYNALEPYIDAQTMEIHYSKHHAAYVKNVNEAIAAENASFNSEKEFLANASKLSPKIRNNAGGVWNHNFFWAVMKPGSTSPPTGKAAEALNSAFGSFDKFKEQFTQAAMSRFGSGWAWLVKSNGKLTIGSTPNQDNPLMDVGDFKGVPILGLDVWEHAYYLKYQNKRNEYVANWWNVVNWDEVSKQL
jgi:superoxide dismutase, Fe-Mn family